LTELESLQAEMQIDSAAVTSFLTKFIAAKVGELEREGVILGLSGGVDSAVVADLCRKAVGSGEPPPGQARGLLTFRDRSAKAESYHL
jgi:NH3-dependent NAD+ synthetase